jgi:hypothetical protein
MHTTKTSPGGGRSYLNKLGPLSEKEQAVIGPIAVE